METAICTRCQSSNPLYTKYCLTCGLEITQKMRIRIATAREKAAPVVEHKAEDEPHDSVLEAQESATDDDQSQALKDKESSIWSRLFGK